MLILAWRENYGQSSESGFGSIVTSVKESVGVIQKHPAVLCLGLSQAFFEGGVYTFGEIYLMTMMH